MQSANAINPKDIIDIAIRRRWFILTPLFLTLICGIYYAFTAPKIYEATVMVMVEPQQVPTEFVRSVVTENAESMYGVMSQQITSRTNIKRIINDFNLMPKNRPDIFIEDLVDSMKQKIEIAVSPRKHGADTLTISFRDTNPQMVMEIANALAITFIDANLIEREFQATDTNTFLEGELENVRKRLLVMEGEIKEYRQRNMGALPSQLESNLAVLKGLRDQLTSKEASLRNIKINISEVEDQIAASSDGPLDPNDLGSMEKQLSSLLMRYTDNHPDVLRLKKRIEEIEQGTHASGMTGRLSSSAFSRKMAELMRDKSALENQIARLQNQMAIYQARVEDTPKREQELISLNRDYNNMEKLYDSLLKRKLESEVSINMEKKQKGERFQILEHAQLPKKSVKPDLRRIFMMTMAVGLGLGCGLAFFLEFQESSYRRPEQIEEDFNIPVIATIPAIYTMKTVFKKRIDMGLCSLFALIILVLIGTFSFLTLWGGDQALDIFKNYVSL